MIEKRRSIRVDVNNICEIKIGGTTNFGFCFLKDISILGVGFLSTERYNIDEVANFTIVLDDKIINLEVKIIATYYNDGTQSRYGAEITKIDDVSKIILEDYITTRVHKKWNETMEKLIKN